jgi:hypothetical protein
MEDDQMNSKFKLVLIIAAFVIFIGASARMAHANARSERMAQAQQNKSAPSTTDKNQAAPAAGCSLLTPAMVQKVLGVPIKDNSAGVKMPPAYENTAWGSACEYGGTLGPGSSVRVNFVVYVEASAAEAKKVFDEATVFYIDNSKPKPAIGDSAYWETPLVKKKEPSIHVLKGKVHFKLGIVPANEKQMLDLAAAVAAGI